MYLLLPFSPPQRPRCNRREGWRDGDRKLVGRLFPLPIVASHTLSIFLLGYPAEACAKERAATLRVVELKWKHILPTTYMG